MRTVFGAPRALAAIAAALAATILLAPPQAAAQTDCRPAYEMGRLLGSQGVIRPHQLAVGWYQSYLPFGCGDAFLQGESAGAATYPGWTVNPNPAPPGPIPRDPPPLPRPDPPPASQGRASVNAFMTMNARCTSYCNARARASGDNVSGGYDVSPTPLPTASDLERRYSACLDARANFNLVAGEHLSGDPCASHR